MPTTKPSYLYRLAQTKSVHIAYSSGTLATMNTVIDLVS